MSDLSVGTGDWEKVDFSKYTSISTEHLGPCVACVSSNGTIAHLNPDWQGPHQIQEYIRWLRQNANPATDEIALIGGMDKRTTYHAFESSEHMAAFLEGELSKAGFRVKFRDLLGMKQRKVVLHANGNIAITDGWHPEYAVHHKFNAAAEAAAGKIISVKPPVAESVGHFESAIRHGNVDEYAKLVAASEHPAAETFARQTRKWSAHLKRIGVAAEDGAITNVEAALNALKRSKVVAIVEKAAGHLHV